MRASYRSHNGEDCRQAETTERGDGCADDPNLIEMIAGRHVHSAQQESLFGSLKREIATIFSASAIVG
jgi:hypothetical protein